MLATSILEIATFFGIWATVWLPIAWSIALSIHWQPQQPLTVKQKLILLASLYILAPIVLWWKFPSQELSFAAVGLSWQLSLWASLGLGLTLGVVSLAIIFSGESWLGLVSWHWQNSRLLLPPILPILGLSLGISLVEELVFRGYVLDTLLADYSYWMGGGDIQFDFCSTTSNLGKENYSPSTTWVVVNGNDFSRGKIGRPRQLGFSLGTSYWLDLGFNLS